MRTLFLRMTGVLCLLFGTVRFLPAAPDEDPMYHVMRLVGAQTPEDVTEDDFERFSRYLAHPVPVNLISRDRLVASGLMSAYQAASLADYRDRHGDVLSAAELSLVDGFSAGTAEKLAPFISFDSDALPGDSSYGRIRVRNEAVARGGWKRAGESDTYSYGMKYRMSAGYGFDAGLSLSRAYSDKTHWPAAQSFFFAYNGRKYLSRLVVGDYNLRYGQGLALWTGFSMSGVGAPPAVFRRASGVSPYWSWSGEGSRRGVAADLRFGAVNVSASLAVGGLRELAGGVRDAPVVLSPSLNAGWMWRSFKVSVTYAATTRNFRRRKEISDASGDGPQEAFDEMKVAADFAWNIRGTDVFGEAAYDIPEHCPAAVFGSRFRCGEALTLALGGRYYPAAYSGIHSGAVRSGSRCANEHGAYVTGEFAAGSRVALKGKEGFGSSVQRHSGSFSVDAAYFPEKKSGMPPQSGQLKLFLNYNIQVSPSVAVDFKLTERLRTWSEVRSRTEARADVIYMNGGWRGTFRFNALYGRNLSMLSYLEGGWRDNVFSVYVRAGAFKVDEWDDRIYVYERDAPGSFNVPACYGRGYRVSLSAGTKCLRWFKVYLRASFTGYPWMPPDKEKPSKAELKLQVMCSL